MHGWVGSKAESNPRAPAKGSSDETAFEVIQGAFPFCSQILGFRRASAFYSTICCRPKTHRVHSPHPLTRRAEKKELKGNRRTLAPTLQTSGNKAHQRNSVNRDRLIGYFQNLNKPTRGIMDLSPPPPRADMAELVVFESKRSG